MTERLRRTYLLVAGGLLMGTGLFLGGYASLTSPYVAVPTVLFLLAGVLFSEAVRTDMPVLYVAASILLAITVGVSVLVRDLLVVPAGACCFLGPVLVGSGLRSLRSQQARG